MGIKYNAHTEPWFKKFELVKVTDIFKLSMLRFYYKLINKALPAYFDNILSQPYIVSHDHDTRNKDHSHLDLSRTKSASKCIRYLLPLLLQNTLSSISSKLSTHSLKGFCNYAKNIYINGYTFVCNDHDCYVCQEND